GTAQPHCVGMSDEPAGFAERDEDVRLRHAGRKRNLARRVKAVSGCRTHESLRGLRGKTLAYMFRPFHVETSRLRPILRAGLCSARDTRVTAEGLVGRWVGWVRHRSAKASAERQVR